MKKVYLTLSALLLAGLTQAASLQYIPSTSTFFNYTENIASGTIRTFNTRTLTSTGSLHLDGSTIDGTRTDNSSTTYTGRNTFTGAIVIGTSTISGNLTLNSTNVFTGGNTFNSWTISNGSSTVNGSTISNNAAIIQGTLTDSSTITFQGGVFTGTKTDNSTTTVTGGYAFPSGVAAPTIGGNSIPALVSTQTWTGGNTFALISISSMTTDANAQNHKITNLSSATVSSDATRYSQNKLLNVQQFTVTTASASTASVFTASNLLGTITPSSTSSKVKILACFSGVIGNATLIADYTLERGTIGSATNLGSATGLTTIGGSATSTVTNLSVPVCITFLDSPGSTSQQTYTVYQRNEGSSVSVATGLSTQTQTIILEEINGL